jgi:hypothetical protein
VHTWDIRDSMHVGAELDEDVAAGDAPQNPIQEADDVDDAGQGAQIGGDWDDVADGADAASVGGSSTCKRESIAGYILLLPTTWPASNSYLCYYTA